MQRIPPCWIPALLALALPAAAQADEGCFVELQRVEPADGAGVRLGGAAASPMDRHAVDDGDRVVFQVAAGHRAVIGLHASASGPALDALRVAAPADAPVRLVVSALRGACAAIGGQNGVYRLTLQRPYLLRLRRLEAAAGPGAFSIGDSQAETWFVVNEGRARISVGSGATVELTEESGALTARGESTSLTGHHTERYREITAEAEAAGPYPAPELPVVDDEDRDRSALFLAGAHGLAGIPVGAALSDRWGGELHAAVLSPPLGPTSIRIGGGLSAGFLRSTFAHPTRGATDVTEADAALQLVLTGAPTAWLRIRTQLGVGARSFSGHELREVSLSGRADLALDWLFYDGLGASLLLRGTVTSTGAGRAADDSVPDGAFGVGLGLVWYGE